MSSSSEKSSLEGLLEECLEEGCNSSVSLQSQIAPYPASKSAIRRFYRTLILHACLILLYTIVLILAVRYLAKSDLCNSIDTHSPAREAIIYEAQQFEIANPQDSEYVREPSPEVDEAWNSLIQHQNIRIPATVMENLGRLDEGIRFPDGGYFSSLMVYHQLHCIKRLYRHMYPEYYFPNHTAEERNMNRLHSMHCLDSLRQGIMCQGDTSLLTMRWGKLQAIPLANFSSPHQCVDWKRLDAWAEERSVDVFQSGMLVHPLYGPSFPDGKAHHLGIVEDE